MRKRIKYRDKVIPRMVMSKKEGLCFNKLYIQEKKNYWGIKTVKTRVILLSNGPVRQEVLEESEKTKKYFIN